MWTVEKGQSALVWVSRFLGIVLLLVLRSFMAKLSAIAVTCSLSLNRFQWRPFELDACEKYRANDDVSIVRLLFHMKVLIGVVVVLSLNTQSNEREKVYIRNLNKNLAIQLARDSYLTGAYLSWQVGCRSWVAVCSFGWAGLYKEVKAMSVSLKYSFRRFRAKPNLKASLKLRTEPSKRKKKTSTKPS